MKLLHGWIIKIWAESKRRYTTCMRFLTESTITLKKKRNLHFLEDVRSWKSTLCLTTSEKLSKLKNQQTF